MKLSELKRGESGVIVNVHGHGGFRKRIVEMGFIKGTLVEVVLNAPLRDPVKYKLMDYEVSLRRAEAELVEIVSTEEAKQLAHQRATVPGIPVDEHQYMRQIAEERGKNIDVVLVGNPNCGKTSLFNMAVGTHERVGNYSGVTVDAKKGEVDFEGYHFTIIDLPGTYSLTAYSPEELYVRKYIIEQHPEVLINVVDASNLERNLYLTTQLIDMDVPMIMSLNMYDELIRSGNQLNTDWLGRLLGVPVVHTVGRTGEGIDSLLRSIIDIYEGKQQTVRHIHINHGPLIESMIERIEEPIRKNPEPHQNYSGRFLAIKLLENDRQVEDIIRRLDNSDEIMAVRTQCQQAIRDELDEDPESAITDAKYGFVQGALRECFEKRRRTQNHMQTKRIDAFVTNRWLGHIIFLAVMYLTFYATFQLGQYPMQWIDSAVSWIGSTVGSLMPQGMLHDLIVDGIIAGVGGVIVFLPNILILYAIISWMEDTGYMARVAFIMDKIMHKMGLHGKSFIPMIMGFGCNIPAVMATRTIEDPKSRLITMLIIPLMSCSARLPVYITIIGAFFPRHATLVLFSLYTVGIAFSVVMAKLFSRFVVHGESSPFVMELPPYRMPSAKSVLRHTWEKGKQYIRKMGTTILAASIIIWVLSYFPHNASLPTEARMEQSYLGTIGKAIEPALRPCGFSWKEDVSLITGLGAKEVITSTMGVLYGAQADTDSEPTQQSRLSTAIAQGGMTTATAAAFLLFVLLYMPCLPTCIAIRHESGQRRWALFTALYTTLLAWAVAAIVYQTATALV